MAPILWLIGSLEIHRHQRDGVDCGKCKSGLASKDHASRTPTIECRRLACICLYIYIYIVNRERDLCMCICTCIYVYVCYTTINQNVFQYLVMQG